jgi:ribosomal protein S18 acetylase RimI-like enzyme
MVKASKLDKRLIIDILTESFSENLSVQYILKNGANKQKRVRALMDYSFEVCMLWGEVFISYDRKACALVMLPYLKKDTFRSTILDIKLILTCTGFAKIKRVLQRERLIKQKHPTTKMYYLWFIGVAKSDQNKGIGSMLLKEILKRATLKDLPIYLETSTIKNIPWYQKVGFKEYALLDLGYILHFLSKP